MNAAEFQRQLDVSRETMAALETYDRLLKKWQKAINLVGPRTIEDSWARHFYDSAQLFAMAPDDVRHGTWLDMGAGAGFPGLVVAMLGAAHVHLVESDQRKSTFMREVIRATGAPATVYTERVERLTPFPVDVITARAFAPLPKLLEMAAPFWGEKSIALFPKGRDVEIELTAAAKCWIIQPELLASQTHDEARILRLRKIERR